MKRISTYITEKLHINNTTKIEYMYHPKNKDELIKCIKEKIKKEGLGTENNPLDLNDIDTSKITDMSELFSNTIDAPLLELSLNGHFNISDWDVSNVEDMRMMFHGSNFDDDLSDWDVSNVINMSYMFVGSKFDGNISKWDVGEVKNMACMFANSKFSGKIDKWQIQDDTNIYKMFDGSPLKNNPPKWYK